jgi:hypothetical protein
MLETARPSRVFLIDVASESLREGARSGFRVNEA